MNNNPFNVLSALRNSLPEGEEITTNTPQKQSHNVLKLFYEVKGRGGKPATIISCPIDMSDNEVSTLASELKKKLATGGSTRGGEILLLGDHRQQLRDILEAKGFTVKG